MKNLADKLGTLQAAIAELRKEEKALKGAILESQEDVTEGDLFRAVIVEQERNTVNWQKIAKDLGATAQRIKANTTTKPVISIKVTALQTNAKAA